MLVGCRASVWAAPRCCRVASRNFQRRPPARYYCAGPNPAATSSEAASPLASLAGLTSELDRLSPRFEIRASQIRILKEPVEFYQTLKDKILNAKKRIYLATLYIGKAEKELVSTIDEALTKNPELKVSILIDALRGTREAPDPSSASLLAPLVAEYGPERVELRMFHTPNLTGIRKKMIPRRINEGWGLQHMKLYGIDDEVIISGANLSNDYFTNRQDRYHVFHSEQLTEYYSLIHSAVCSISFLVQPDQHTNLGTFLLTWPSSNPCLSPLEDPKAYNKFASSLLRPLISPSRQHAPLSSQHSLADTFVYPLFQLTPFFVGNETSDASTELPALTALLSSLSDKANHDSVLHQAAWTFTAGYFNMTPDIRNLLLASNPTAAIVIAASPEANGFYGSKGISGMLPAAYTLLEKRFLQAVQSAGLGNRIKVMEWRKGIVGEEYGWTYHAKGIWVTLSGEQGGRHKALSRKGDNGSKRTANDTEHRGPSIALVGSSNYTARSYSLDLEANALIITRNRDLMKRLGEEENWLQEHAREVNQDEFAKIERRVGLHVRIAMWIVGLVGGAL